MTIKFSGWYQDGLKDKEYLKILWEAEDGKDLMHKLQIKQPDVLLMDHPHA
jgi:chemotaxis response regulator CheB